MKASILSPPPPPPHSPLPFSSRTNRRRIKGSSQSASRIFFRRKEEEKEEESSGRRKNKVKVSPSLSLSSCRGKKVSTEEKGENLSPSFSVERERERRETVRSCAFSPHLLTRGLLFFCTAVITELRKMQFSSDLDLSLVLT